MKSRMGIDLGGTKIEGAVFDGGGEEVARKRISTPKGSYPETLEALCELVGALEQAAESRAVSIGIGTPGSPSPATGLIRNANSTCLNGQPLQDDLQARLGRTVHLANDADCFALSEAVDGAGAGARTVFGVILGTGVGGGIVVNGQLLDGPNGIAGEWGHTPFPHDPDTPRDACYCGRTGCIETVLCGPSLARDHLRATGQNMDAQEIARQAAAGDLPSVATVARYAARLGRALAVVINILDPDVVVLGGGVSNIDALYNAVPGTWTEQIFSDVVRTRLERAHWGDAGGVRGAAWLAKD